MKRMIVLFVVLALALAMFTGCGPRAGYRDGSNVSTTDDGTVNGVNPDGPGVMGGMDDGDAAEDGRVVTGTGVTENAQTHNGSR